MKSDKNGLSPLQQRLLQQAERLFPPESSAVLRLISWALPLFLFFLAAGVELLEELILEKFSWYPSVHIVFETFLFGVIGPLVVFFVLLYIRALMQEELWLRQRLEMANRDLEKIVQQRTAELQASYQQLQQANRQLRELDRLKSDFVSLVSHELRAPLTTLNGAIEMALQWQAELPPAARRVFLAMQRETERLTQFVQTILDVSRLEAGRIEINLGPVAVMPLLHRAVEVALGNRRTVRWHLSNSAIPPVLADEIYLEQVIRNLLRNAEKYAPPEQPIEIFVSFDDKKAQIEIADHGPGIPDSLRPHLFTRFQRGQRGENAPPGWGLGLYFVRKLLEAQRAEVAVRSPRWEESGAPGSSFTLSIPLAICMEAFDDGDNLAH